MFKKAFNFSPKPGRCLLPCVAAAAVLTLLDISTAFAQEASKGPSEVIFLGQLIVLMAVGRLLGEAMQQIGQPSVMGQLIAGILLGPTVFGWLFPDIQHALFPRTPEQKAMIDGISQFGILLLLLLTGMETDLKLVKKVGKAAFSISITGVAVPFACGFALGEFMPDWLLPRPDQRLLTSLFLGTALSISSIKIVAAIVREMGFTRRNLGQVIVASAICEDTIGWVIIAITFGLAEAGTINLMSVGKSVLGTALFLILSFTVGRRIVFFLIRWANDNFKSEFFVITTILVIMGLMALITNAIGVHTVLGAFVAGVLVGGSPILSKHIDEQLRGLILAFFMPVFFGMAGLSADLTILKDPNLLMMALALIAIASIGKFAGAFIGAEIGGLSRREALALACGMNARGSTEVIVATIGLSMGALSQNLFTMIVAMAVLTTMAMPPMLRWGLARVPLSEAERERLEREEFEARGFVPNLERLLVVVDGSSSGKLASQLAGLVAGSRGMPITVLPLESGKSKMAPAKIAEFKEVGRKNVEDKSKDAPAESSSKNDVEILVPQEGSSAEVVKAAAEQKPPPIEKDDEPPPPVEVLVRNPDKPLKEAVKEEAEKGYDLLFLGIDNAKGKGGGFHPDISRIASAFEGPLALVIKHNGKSGSETRKQDADSHPNGCPHHILVPVTGTEVSRRAAEIAIVLGRACKVPVTALYVSTRKPTGPGRRRKSFRTRRQEQAILKEVVKLADRYDFTIKTAVATDPAPDNAIVSATRRNGYDLLVMGVSRRTGDILDFGDTATAVLENADSSILFVAS
jgi:Kef-type K+ transport system membrane component KefB/nucleotide-binding universal stress UspA family protein